MICFVGVLRPSLNLFRKDHTMCRRKAAKRPMLDGKPTIRRIALSALYNLEVFFFDQDPGFIMVFILNLYEHVSEGFYINIKSSSDLEK